MQLIKKVMKKLYFKWDIKYIHRFQILNLEYSYVDFVMLVPILIMLELYQQ